VTGGKELRLPDRGVVRMGIKIGGKIFRTFDILRIAAKLPTTIGHTTPVLPKALFGSGRYGPFKPLPLSFALLKAIITNTILFVY
jgi:hypothetical protein